MNSDVNHVYHVSKKIEGWGLTSVMFAIKRQQRKVSFYLHHSDDLYMKLIATDYQVYEEHGKEYKPVNNLKHLQP